MKPIAKGTAIYKDKGILSYYALRVIGRMRLSLVVPIMVVFFLSRGLSMVEAGAVQSLATIVSFLVEIPTGAYADSYGRNRALIIGYAIFGLGFLTVAFSDSFVWFLVGLSLAEAGESFVSGSLQAWIVDYMRASGREKEIADVFGQGRTLILLANAIGGAVSGYLAGKDLAFPFLASSLFSLLNAALVACFVREKGRTAVERPSFFRPAREGLKYYVQHRSLVMLTLGSVLVSVGVSCYFLVWQPYLKQSGVGPEIFGITYAIMSIGFSLGSFGGGKFASRFSNKSGVIIGCLIGLGTFCLLPISTAVFVTIFLLVLWEFGFGFHEPGRYAWMNELTPSDVRATLLSLARMLLVGGNALGALLAGFAAEFNLQLPFIFGAIAFLGSAVVFWRTQSTKAGAQVDPDE